MTSSQMFNRQFLRSPTVLLGIGEERPYYVEKSPALLMARLKHNVTFFYLNYLMVLVVLFCLTLLTSPLSIMGMIILGAAWFYVIRHTQQSGNLIVYGTSTPMVVCCKKEDTGCCCCGEEGVCLSIDECGRNMMWAKSAAIRNLGVVVLCELWPRQHPSLNPDPTNWVTRSWRSPGASLFCCSSDDFIPHFLYRHSLSVLLTSPSC
jgi:hypothetical protein